MGQWDSDHYQLSAIGWPLSVGLSASGCRLSADRFAEERGPRPSPPSQKTCPPPQSGVGDHGVVEGGGRYKLQD